MRSSKWASMPEATVGTFVRSVRPRIVISGEGMCATFCDSWFPLVQAAAMRIAESAMSLGMTSISKCSDMLYFDFLELLSGGLELQRGAQCHRSVCSGYRVYRDIRRRP